MDAEQQKKDADRVVRVSPETRRRIKAAAAKLDSTFGEAVARALDALDKELTGRASA